MNNKSINAVLFAIVFILSLSSCGTPKPLTDQQVVEQLELYKHVNDWDNEQ